MTTATEIPNCVVVQHEMSGRRTPLLAVCGVCGGAGATTIATLIARAAAEEGHVLLMDTGGLTGGLSSLTRIQTPWSFLEASDLLVRDPSLGLGLWDVASSDGFELRVIAGGVEVRRDPDPGRIEDALDLLRDEFAHALVVVDCGTLQRDTDRIVLRAASHVAWVTPGSHRGLSQATQLRRHIKPCRGSQELIVTRRDDADPTLPIAALARAWRCPLVLVPELASSLARAEEEAQVAMEAVLGVLRR